MSILLSLRKTCFLALFVCGLFLLPSPAKADPIKNLTAPEVKTLLDDGKVVLIHTLSGIEFEIQHIPGSINIPVINMRDTTLLPEDKTTPLIFYCMGIR